MVCLNLFYICLELLLPCFDTHHDSAVTHTGFGTGFLVFCIHTCKSVCSFSNLVYLGVILVLYDIQFCFA